MYQEALQLRRMQLVREDGMTGILCWSMEMANL